MRIKVSKPNEIMTIPWGNIDSLHTIVSVTGKPNVVATLKSGRREVLCVRNSGDECEQEIETIYQGVEAERAEDRTDVMMSLPYWPPKKPAPETPKPEEAAPQETDKKPEA